MDARDRVAGLGLRGGTLSLTQLASGQPVVVSLTDVQALWAIMLTLVTTLDADLATTEAGQAALLRRWNFLTYRVTQNPRRSGGSGPRRS